MKVKLEGIPIPEGWNTRTASGWSMKKILCGNTAHWSTRGRKLIPNENPQKIQELSLKTNK